ncbi:conserved hypothetical protein [Ricinus communis]|uniref:Uncharacterized protein n=1 Tax=Ricinus communis TaxID=3988 RepID=B9TGT6_RICCO|nr:conserved hypothetical protein [Ricinus communis]
MQAEGVSSRDHLPKDPAASGTMARRRRSMRAGGQRLATPQTPTLDKARGLVAMPFVLARRNTALLPSFSRSFFDVRPPLKARRPGR